MLKKLSSIALLSVVCMSQAHADLANIKLNQKKLQNGFSMGKTPSLVELMPNSQWSCTVFPVSTMKVAPITGQELYRFVRRGPSLMNAGTSKTTYLDITDERVEGRSVSDNTLIEYFRTIPGKDQSVPYLIVESTMPATKRKNANPSAVAGAERTVISYSVCEVSSSVKTPSFKMNANDGDNGMYEYNFEADQIMGNGISGDDSLKVNVRARRFIPLIRLRTDYLPELYKSVEQF